MTNTRFRLERLAAMVPAGLAVAALAALFATTAGAQEIRTPRQMPFPQDPDFDELAVETLHVQGNISMIAGAGANIAVQTGHEGVLIVDTGYPQMSGKVLAAIGELSPNPLWTIINTTLADDHTGANGQMVAAGTMNQAGPGLGGRPNEGDLIAHSSLLRLMTEIGEDTIPTDRWPPSTFYGDSKDLHSNGEPVVIMHVPNATTSGDTIVWFRSSDVIVSGEIFNQTSFPHIDVEHGGHINGVIAGLNTMLDIIVPEHLQEGGTMVIPSHGRVSDEHDVVEYRDMVTIVRDRVQAAIDDGRTLADIRALEQSLTYEYEPRFDRDPGWTAEMFVEAIHRNLTSGE